MAKKTLIVSHKQIEEICGGDSTYLDGLALKPDMGKIYGMETTTDGSLDDGYPMPTTTDDRSHEMAVTWRGNAKLAGMGPAVVREMTKKEWEQRFVIAEEKEHGNARLQARSFGAQNGEAGKSYDATKMAVSRLERAQKEILTGATAEIKQKAANRVARMKKNWGGIEIAARQYKTAKDNDKSMQQSKIGPKIASAPKEVGNGKAHSPKNGIITN